MRSRLTHLQDRLAGDAPEGAAERVVRAASQLFVANGYEGTSTDAIARAADVKPSALYRLFDSKDAILVAALENLFEGFLADMAASVQGVSDPRARLVRMAWAHTWVQLSFEIFGRGAVGMAFSTGQLLSAVSPERSDRLRLLARAHVASVRGAIEAGGSDGLFVVPDVRTATQAIVTIAEYAPLWYRAGGPLTPEQVADHHGAYALRVAGGSVDDGYTEAAFVQHCLSDEVVDADVAAAGAASP